MNALVELEEVEVVLLRVYLMMQYHRAETTSKTRSQLTLIINKLDRAKNEINFRKRQDLMLSEPKEDSAFE